MTDREAKEEPKRQCKTERETVSEIETWRGEDAEREIHASNAVVLAYARPTALLALASNAVVLAYAHPTAALALACNAVVLACATGSSSGGTYLVAHESVHMCMSGECVHVREFCLSLRLFVWIRWHISGCT